jgi:hypothetical protein
MDSPKTALMRANSDSGVVLTNIPNHFIVSNAEKKGSDPFFYHYFPQLSSQNSLLFYP